MNQKPIFQLILIGLVLLSVTAFGQEKKDKKRTDEEILKDAPAVVEYRETVYSYNDDGTGQQSVRMRVRIQNEQGRAAYGQVYAPYQTELSTAEFEYARAVKPDGTVVEADVSKPLEQTSPVSQIAPMFTDFRYKIVPVPGLQVGDALEFKATVHILTPLKPGDFWIDHFAVLNIPSLREEVRLEIPAGRTVLTYQTKEYEYDTETRENLTIHRWRFSNPRGADKKFKKTPRLLASSLKEWSQIGDWYLGLEADRSEANEEIRAKALELTEGLETPREKTAALFRYVSQNIRYVSISLGLGGYQPHAAEEIFGNQYGDCKDKHTLLATMLDVVGVATRPALLRSFGKVEPAVPSPGQFDHLITTVELDGERIWMDATMEVAPLGFLPREWRGEKALLIEPGNSVLVEMPERVPIEDLARSRLSGEINADGKLIAEIGYETRGTYEVQWRSAFRIGTDEQIKSGLRAARPYTMWGAEVEDLKNDDPEIHGEAPFSFQYELTQDKYINPAKESVEVTLPALILARLPWRIPEEPEEDDDDDGENSESDETADKSDVATETREDEKEEDDIDLGGLGLLEEAIDLTVDPVYDVQELTGIREVTDFAIYESNYEFNHNQLTVKRTLEILEPNIPASRRDELIRFNRLIRQDRDREFLFERKEKYDLIAAAADYTADELNSAGNDAVSSGRSGQALHLFKMATEKDTAHKSAWRNLGRVLRRLGRLEEAEAAVRRQIEISPESEYAWNTLGLTLADAGRNEEAVEAFQKQIEISPMGAFAYDNLGRTLTVMDRWAEAEAAYEKSLGINRKSGSALVGLGIAQVLQGDAEQARENFNKALEISDGASRYNNIAYQLAKGGKELDLALRYATSAMTRTEAELLVIDSAEDWKKAIRMQSALGAYTDTLAWVLYKQEEYEEALSYAENGYALRRSSERAEHLAAIHGKLDNPAAATRYYKMAVLLSLGRKIEPPEGVAIDLDELPSPSDRREAGRLLNADGEKNRAIRLPEDDPAKFPDDAELPEEMIEVFVACLVRSSGKVDDAVAVEGDSPWSEAAVADATRIMFERLSWGRPGLKLIRWARFRYEPDGSVTVLEPVALRSLSPQELSFD